MRVRVGVRVRVRARVRVVRGYESVAAQHSDRRGHQHVATDVAATITAATTTAHPSAIGGLASSPPQQEPTSCGGAADARA